MTSSTSVVFIGHGNPMNAITSNSFRDAWRQLGRELPKPQSVLCISAHWETQEPQVCIADPPRTIHDFGGFPADLYAQQYPAPGAPVLADKVQALAGETRIGRDSEWGLDHGAWCVLQALFPDADVPVAQLSLARAFAPAEHLDFARKLAPLRDDGVLVLCSGNVVHNLRLLGGGATPAWAREFDTYVAQAIERHDDEALVSYERSGASARYAVPTREHYLPLLYAAGMRRSGDRVRFFTEGFDLGSIGMRSVLFS